jgi:hypothetical protein
LDATDKGNVGLAAYYTERGESPGVCVGSGLDGIDGLGAVDAVELAGQIAKDSRPRASTVAGYDLTFSP